MPSLPTRPLSRLGIPYRATVSDASAHEREQQGIRVRRATEADRERWDDLIRSSPQGTVFHTRAVLRVLADQSGTTLHPLVGLKGQEPVGLLPLFVYSRAGIRAVFSPPPDLRIPYLGPTLCNVDGLKQGRAEKRNRRFVEAALSWMDDVAAPAYVHVRTAPGYHDSRPFGWNGFDVTPRYTYRVDLTLGEEELLGRFRKDARRYATREYDRLSIRVGGRAEVADLIDQVRRRFAQQGEWFGVSTGFAIALYDRTADGVVRPYVCDVDGEPVGGILTLRDDATVYGWQGRVKRDVDVPVNEALDWHIMRAAIDDGRRSYDLVGANTPHLCEYKAKFAPDLVTYYSLERAGPVATVAAEAYRRYTRR